MKKNIHWLFYTFFIAGFVFGALKYTYILPSWTMILVGVALGVISSLLQKKLNKE